ncbi:MAG TPA: GlsB/YeaQ/YmgE family stress response membrane protein [Pyrinomonadaceae bacterium]
MDIGDIISWIVVGAIAGIIAKLLMPGKDPGGCIITIVLGIVGASLAGYLAHLLRISAETKELGDRGFFTKVGFGIVGAIIILAVYRLIAGRRT